jgi:phospholipase B1, membrane-associated
LNAAQSGGKVADIANQIDYLKIQGRREEGINFDKDWKILNILIGGNNLFECELPESAPEVYEQRMNETLSKIHNEIPKVFVNLISFFEEGMIDIWNNGKASTYCSRLWSFLGRSLPCMVTTDELRRKLVNTSRAYNNILEKLANWWNENRKRKDFFVSVQPVLKNSQVPDLTWASSFDCLHPSDKSNEETARAVWNSMQLPRGKKPTELGNGFLCPDENTLVQ